MLCVVQRTMMARIDSQPAMTDASYDRSAPASAALKRRTRRQQRAVLISLRSYAGKRFAIRV